jgi:hypothetical protein
MCFLNGAENVSLAFDQFSKQDKSIGSNWNRWNSLLISRKQINQEHQIHLHKTKQEIKRPISLKTLGISPEQKYKKSQTCCRLISAPCLRFCRILSVF